MKLLAHRMVKFWCAALIDEGLIDNEEKKLYFTMKWCMPY